MKVLVLNPPSKFTKNIIRDLIYGCWCKGKRIGGAKTPPTNLLYVATVLKHSGHKVKLLDAIAEQKLLENVLKEIKNCDVIVTSTSTMSFNEDAEILHELKKVNKKMTTIVFGSHPTFMPKHSLEKEGVDIIVRREPEYIIRDVVNSLEKRGNSWKKIKGIGFKEKGRKILNGFYPFIENLDELPMLDRKLLPRDVDYFSPIVRRIPYTTLMTSRGCPGRCTFCTVPSFYGNKIRHQSAKRVFDEMETIKDEGYREIWFRDETFTAHRKRNEELCRMIINSGLDITWICNARVGTLKKDMIKLLKDAGCHMIKFGVESGVQDILNNIKKDVKVELTRKTFKWTHEVGIDTHAHMMLGCPGDSRKTIEKTMKFVREIDPTTVTFGVCTPYAGTELFKQVSNEHPDIEDGSSCNLSKIHEKSFFNEYFTELSSDELEKYVKKAYKSFYFRPSYLWKWLKKIKNVDELKRVILAGTNVFEFSMGID